MFVDVEVEVSRPEMVNLVNEAVAPEMRATLVIRVTETQLRCLSPVLLPCATAYTKPGACSAKGLLHNDALRKRTGYAA